LTRFEKVLARFLFVLAGFASVLARFLFLLATFNCFETPEDLDAK
jgi:hypothetical protein